MTETEEIIFTCIVEKLKTTLGLNVAMDNSLLDYLARLVVKSRPTARRPIRS